VSQPLTFHPLATTPQHRSLRQLGSWGIRRWTVALVAAAVVAAAAGIPTDVLPTDLYRRMTPVVWWNYPIWALSAMLAGLVIASYVRSGDAAPARGQDGGGVVGGLASFFAVGCPICNKLVVALLGVGGALSYFAPIQPVLGVLGVALLAATLVMRLRRLAACSAPLSGSGLAIPRSST
jgi:hypothetical protein